MPEPIEQYIPTLQRKNLRKRAYQAWAFGLSAAFIWVLFILAAPVAKAYGFLGISSVIYKSFSFLCHQLPERSFHILGDQFAVCSRCFGVYFGLVFGFVIYPLIRNIEELEPFKRIWLFLSLVPIGIDWSLGIFGIWDNTHLSRFLTGMILGTACALFIIPAIVELGQLFANKRKLKRVRN